MSFVDDIAIVIVNYNSEAVIKDCIDPLQALANIYIVDNGSDKKSIDFIKTNFPAITLIENNQNLGYGRGFNVGLSRVKTKYVLAVTPDARFSMDDLERLHQAAESYPEVGIIAPLLDVPRIGVETWIMGPNELNHHRADYTPDGPFCSWFVAGAVCLYSMEAMQKIGGFDENIFLYNEDLDLCLRMHQAGYSLIYIADLIAHHINSASAPQTDKLHWRKDWNFAWGHLYILNKYAGPDAAKEAAWKMIRAKGIKSLFYLITLGKKRFIRDFAATHGAISFLLGKKPKPSS